MIKPISIFLIAYGLSWGVEVSLPKDPPEINGLTLWKVAKMKDDVATYNPNFQKDYLAIALGVVTGLDNGVLVNEMIKSHSMYKTVSITSYLLKCESGNVIRLTSGPFGWYAKLSGKAELEGVYYSAVSVTLLYKDKWDYWSKAAESSINQGNQKTEGILLKYIREPSSELEKAMALKMGVSVP